MSPKGSQNGAQSAWEGEISLGNFSGAPPEDNNEFFFGPGGLRERFGGLPGRPKRTPEASRTHFGTIFGAKMEPRGFTFRVFLDTLGFYFGHLRFLLSQASRLC